MGTYHILPVEHLQDVAEELTASLELLLLLQVELQLVGHEGKQDLTAICDRGGRTKGSTAPPPLNIPSEIPQEFTPQLLGSRRTGAQWQKAK